MTNLRNLFTSPQHFPWNFHIATPDMKDPSKVSSLINSEHIQSTNHTLEPNHKLLAVQTSGIFHPLKWLLQVYETLN
jgi:hypothetical protein